MDSKKNIKEEVELALKSLHKQIDSLKEKVDELCENSGCFKTVGDETPEKNKK